MVFFLVSFIMVSVKFLYRFSLPPRFWFLSILISISSTLGIFQLLAKKFKLKINLTRLSSDRWGRKSNSFLVLFISLNMFIGSLTYSGSYLLSTVFKSKESTAIVTDKGFRRNKNSKTYYLDIRRQKVNYRVWLPKYDQESIQIGDKVVIHSVKTPLMEVIRDFKKDYR